MIRAAALRERAVEPRAASELEVGLALAARFTRRHAIAAIYRSGRGDASGALSSVEVLACLYGAELNLWPSTVSDPDRDRLVLSCDAALPSLFAAGVHYGFCDSSMPLHRNGPALQ